MYELRAGESGPEGDKDAVYKPLESHPRRKRDPLGAPEGKVKTLGMGLGLFPCPSIHVSNT